MSIEEITLIRLEYNSSNGFILNILNLSIGDFEERSLLGISFANRYCYIDILFFKILRYENYNT